MAGFLPRQRKHGNPADADTTAVHAKTLAFSAHSEFSVATGGGWAIRPNATIYDWCPEVLGQCVPNRLNLNAVLNHVLRITDRADRDVVAKTRIKRLDLRDVCT